MKIEHDIVESYWVELLPNGVFHLLFNCKKRGFYVHQYNSYSYLFTGSFDDEYTANDIIDIEHFLPKLETGMYSKAESRNKDQVSFYFIPIESGYIKNRKIIIK